MVLHLREALLPEKAALKPFAGKIFKKTAGKESPQ